MKLAERIVADPDTCSGHPRIEGTRIRVAHILGWLSAGMTEAQIIDEYPQLSAADIRAALAFSATVVDREPIAVE